MVAQTDNNGLETIMPGIWTRAVALWGRYCAMFRSFPAYEVQPLTEEAFDTVIGYTV